MKPLGILSFFLIASAFVTFTACEDILPDQNDDCEQTKMPDVIEPVLIIKVLLLEDTINGDTAHIVRKAATGLFTGTVTKVYCDGTLSGSFNVNTTVFPAEYTSEYLEGIKVGQAYQFKFENRKDYILVDLRLKATFKDGKTYQSVDVIRKFFHNDLIFDPVNGDNYFWLIFIPEEEWVEVEW